MRPWSRSSSDRGFTLIELLVVVLILGILLAIAIPTFGSLTSSAKAGGAESNVTIAAGDEAVYFAENGGYGISTAMSSVDGGLNWQTCTTALSTCVVADQGGQKFVYALPLTDASSYPSVMIGAVASTGKYYWELLTQNPTVASPSYQVLTTSITPSTAVFEAASPFKNWKQAGG